MEVQLPEGTYLTAELPDDFDDQGRPTSYKRVEGVIAHVHALDTTAPGESRVLYTITTSQGDVAVATVHICDYSLPDREAGVDVDEGPYLPDRYDEEAYHDSLSNAWDEQ